MLRCMEIARFLLARVAEHTASKARAEARILGLHTADPEHDCPGATGVGPCPTLRLLASSYSWHPDYKPAWARVSV